MTEYKIRQQTTINPVTARPTGTRAFPASVANISFLRRSLYQFKSKKCTYILWHLSQSLSVATLKAVLPSWQLPHDLPFSMSCIDTFTLLRVVWYKGVWQSAHE